MLPQESRRISTRSKVSVYGQTSSHLYLSEAFLIFNSTTPSFLRSALYGLYLRRSESNVRVTWLTAMAEATLNETTADALQDWADVLTRSAARVFLVEEGTHRMWDGERPEKILGEMDCKCRFLCRLLFLKHVCVCSACGCAHICVYVSRDIYMRVCIYVKCVCVFFPSPGCWNSLEVKVSQ